MHYAKYQVNKSAETAYALIPNIRFKVICSHPLAYHANDSLGSISEQITLDTLGSADERKAE
jgi:hypothetical protein